MSNIRDLKSVEDSTSLLPLLGFTVIWRLAGIRVSHPDLEQALRAAGFDKYLPDLPTPRVALRRALAEWIRAKQRASRNSAPERDDEEDEETGQNQRRTLIRVINRARSEHLIFALVAEDIDFSALGLSYGTTLRILLHKKNGEMICTTEAEGVIDARRESQQVADELAPYWREYRNLFISRDLSEMIREIIQGMSAVSLRQAGGVYFVPASEQDQLGRLRHLITQLPQVTEGAFVCALGVPDADEARRTLSKAVHAGLLDEIGSLRGDLARLCESGNRHRDKTIMQRMVIYKQLKEKAAMYQELLGIRQDQVRAGIERLENEARNLLTGDASPSSTTHDAPLRFDSQAPQPIAAI